MKNYILKLMKWTLCIYIIVLPWISIKRTVYYNSDEMVLFSSEIKGVIDCFLYGKSLFTIIIAVILLIMLAVIMLLNRHVIALNYNKYDIVVLACISIYIVCTVMSFFMSKYKKIALMGGINNFEGTLVLISYVILFISAYCIIRLEKELNIKKYAKYWAFIECTILFILAFVELGYKPLYNIIAGYKMVELNGMLTLTFYNSTYCAAFILLLFPFTVLFLFETKSKKHMITWGIYCSLLFICVILTKSTVAFYFSILEFILFMCICLSFKKFNIREIIIKLSVILLETLVIMVLINVGGVNICDYISKSSKNTTESIHKDIYYKINDIIVSENMIDFISDDSRLKCVINEGKLQFKNDKDIIIDVKTDNNVIIFPEQYNMITAGIDRDVLWIDLGYKGILRFYIYDNYFYPMLSNGMLVKDISGSGINTTFDNLFTGRGYIWRNSLDILKNTAIFGHGAGTFEMYFKQFDYVGLLNSQGNVDLIIDKPHNWYIQMACNQGILCACAVIFLIMHIFINTYFSRIKIQKDMLAVSAIISLLVFYMMELLTDSYITVNPEMWILLGIMGGIYKIKKGMNKNE